MSRFLLFFSSCLLFTAASFAKGHGGGHGGHGGGHSSGHSGGGHASAGHAAAAHTSSGHAGGGHSGAAHSGGHSFSGHSSVGGHSSSGGFHSTSHSVPHMSTKTMITRATSPSVIIANHPKKVRTNPAYVVVPPRSDHKVDNPAPGPSYYGYYYPYYPGAFYYDPYFSMWSIGANLAYSPTYGSGGASSDNYDYDYDYNTDDSLEGYVVYAHDTLSGVVTIAASAVYLETADSAQGYDYKFRMRKAELQYVTAYNSDDKQIKLVRLGSNKKRMWRVVHEGKLNLYDDGKGLIYQPEDIDKMNLIAEYSGQQTKLNQLSQVKAKEQLIKCVNEAYGLKLDPKKVNWNELLIYLDKLD